MILKRKMYNKLLTLKNELNGKKAFLIEGARRIGKSTICEEFGKNENKIYIIIEFAKCPDEVKDFFVKYMNDFDTFFMLLSTYYGVKLYERESLIIFDEVQMYPKARECIKYLVADGRYDYIETGSLISI
ncbi:MAG: AAA family ATPase, partial [Ruminococcus sp.]|nr:AAA family ATPase [Ruminococcus sp.]